MLKKLFTSSVRIKILDLFFHNPGEEYYIREMTRLLDEQINSVRRELTNLKKAGVLKSKTKTRKKYYYLDPDFMLHDELKSIFLKASAKNTKLSQAISKIGNIKLLVLSGNFVETEADADLLIVGDIDKLELSHYLEAQIDYPVRFSVMSEEDFKYRLECNDQFVLSMLKNPKSIQPINKLGIL